YYDTAAGALARAGVALRVREIRGRWVQTVKGAGASAAGLHVRDELEWQLASPEPDLALLAGTPLEELFSSATMSGRLAPVFRTEFERVIRPLAWPDGTRAELALDHGSVRAGGRSDPISEMELELQSGDPTRLFELALALSADLPLRLGHASKAERGYLLARIVKRAPQKQRRVELDPAMPLSAAIRRIVLACIAQMQANEEGVVAGRDKEYLHQLRVGLRRARSCISLVRKEVPPERIAPIVEELRWLGRALNPARDWDVFMTETLPPMLQSFPEDPGLAALRARGARMRRASTAAAREMVRSRRYTNLLLSVGSVLAREDLAALTAGAGELSGPVGAFAGRLIDRRDQKLRKRATAVQDATPEARHVARIAAKRLRYAAEFFASLYPPKRVRRYVAALEDIQDTLGELNDLATASRLLADLGVDATNAIDPRAAGIVRGWCAASARHALARFAGDWKRFKSARSFWE
ncbi:MAG: CHAD domain-containing protein, partial [Burkholderiales bacterium]